MKPQLMVLEWMRDGKVGWWRHPAYHNLRQHVFWPRGSSTKPCYPQNENTFLQHMNARMIQMGSNTLIEFESQEDLAQFVLAWS